MQLSQGLVATQAHDPKRVVWYRSTAIKALPEAGLSRTQFAGIFLHKVAGTLNGSLRGTGYFFHKGLTTNGDWIGIGKGHPPAPHKSKQSEGLPEWLRVYCGGTFGA